MVMRYGFFHFEYLYCYLKHIAVKTHRTHYDSLWTIWNSSPILLEVRRLLKVETCSTCARGKDDVSSNELPQNMLFARQSSLKWSNMLLARQQIKPNH